MVWNCNILLGISLLISSGHSLIRAAPLTPENPLSLPAPGDHSLRLLTPVLLELTLITTKDPDPAPVSEWNFVGENHRLTLPHPDEFDVRGGGKRIAVKSVGFKRRAIYAPMKKRDLRIGNHLYLELSEPVGAGDVVEVKNPGGKLWSRSMNFRAEAEPRRWSPVIHVNQTGYVPGFPKKALAGYYRGSMGELPIAKNTPFKLLEKGREVFSGQLQWRPDYGWDLEAYQQVYEADFSPFKKAGEYQLWIPGLGVSFPFHIHEGSAAAFARTYALGLYHQRCGTGKSPPFTRFSHAPCHLEPAAVPTEKHRPIEQFLKGLAAEAKQEPKRTAPPLANLNSSLYPFVNQGEVLVSGGHHDAGDYSKYTINSAGLIHHLVFAADAFPGVGELDNLGLPESGDQKSDLLQVAKWEADFLAKMQDADGGFYFLVYPRDRKYEDDVLPDRGDRQMVFPKNTAATAAAVAALAQTASSPLFKKQFPEAAALYLKKANLGWAFLEKALAKHGRDGAYQRITHYGDEFRHEDELAWAATELFLATGDEKFHRELLKHFDPADRETRRWTWWRLYESYGAAVRSYAFAARTGRLKPGRLDAAFLAKCEAEILEAAEDQVRFARESAYGTSFPDPTKRFRSAGWYFSLDRAFDIAAGWQLESAKDRRPDFLEAMLSNLNYEAGCNPVNVVYLTGLGWKRQRDIVHQFAQNDGRVLPPSGIPIGNIQAGFQFLHHYERELGTVTYPPDGLEKNPYPFYDRWGDSFNVTTEFVVVNQARGLALTAFLMAQTPVKNQPWKAASARIEGAGGEISSGQTVKLGLNVAENLDLDLDQATIVWEANGEEPVFGKEFQWTIRSPGRNWVEAEAVWPDGRRVFALREFQAK